MSERAGGHAPRRAPDLRRIKGLNGARAAGAPGAPRLAAISHGAIDASAPVPKSARVASVLILAVIVGVAGWVFREALVTIRVDLTSMHARREATFWVMDPKLATVPAWERALREAREALRIAPGNPMLHDLMSSLYLARSAMLPVEEAAQRRELLEQALSYQQKSLVLLPQNADGWAESAALRQMLEQGSQAVAADWNKALAYGPYEITVQERLVVIAFAMWQQAPADIKAWVMKRYENASTAERAEMKELADDFEVSLDGGDSAGE